MQTQPNQKYTIEPKSDQLNYDDLLTGPITVTVTGVKRGSAEQPIDVLIEGHRPYRPCKSMRRVLIAAWGERGADWVGHSMTLVGDPDVRFGGVAVGGIRIAAVSHIAGPLSLALTVSRGKRAQYTVQPLAAPDTSDKKAKLASAVQSVRNAIKAGKVGALEPFTDAQKAAIWKEMTHEEQEAYRNAL